MANRWGNSGWLYFWGLQNDCRWWQQPWIQKMFALWKESYDQPRQHIKKKRHFFDNKGLSTQSYGFSSGHVWMWELDSKQCLVSMCPQAITGLEERHRTAKGLWLVRWCSVISADSLLGLMYWSRKAVFLLLCCCDQAALTEQVGWYHQGFLHSPFEYCIINSALLLRIWMES